MTNFLIGEPYKIGIVCAKWNNKLTTKLLNETVEHLKKNSVREQNIVVERVPGSFELPFGAKSLYHKQMKIEKKLDAIIAIGVLIKGETIHFEIISKTVSLKLLDLSLELNIPIVNGILSCNTEKQAFDRSDYINENVYNNGKIWAISTIEMCQINGNVTSAHLS